MPSDASLAVTPEPILSLREVSKAFGAVVALDRVDFDLRAGEVHVLIGENGAGKSTLIRLLTGAHRRDGGEILWHGRPVRVEAPEDAIRMGVAAVYQELSLVPQLSVAENIFLGREPLLPGGRIDWATMHRRAGQSLAEVGRPLDPSARVGDLGMGLRQLVEIAKALSRDARVLILDEPTSSLSQTEIATLLQVIGRLRAQGLAIVFISHKLDEIRAVGDRITVLRDGRRVHHGRVADLSEERMVALMVGRPVTDRFPKRAATRGGPVLRVQGLSREPAFRNVSFTAHRGEVLGVFGLIGAGRTELARCIFGADRADRGEIEVAGRRLPMGDPVAAIRAGIAFLTENRKYEGLLLNQDLVLNATVANLRRFTRWFRLDVGSQRATASELIAALDLRPGDPLRLARELSGGNQQKLVLAKWLNTEARVFIFDEPTRGIDVGAKVEIYRLIHRLTEGGAAVIMISSELPEIVGMSDRILVMREGCLAAEFDRGRTMEAAVMAAAAGSEPW